VLRGSPVDVLLRHDVIPFADEQKGACAGAEVKKSFCISGLRV